MHSYIASVFFMLVGELLFYFPFLRFLTHISESAPGYGYGDREGKYIGHGLTYFQTYQPEESGEYYYKRNKEQSAARGCQYIGAYGLANSL